MRMRKIFLYGGCVIRDAYTLVEDSIGLSAYVARQSLISAASPPTPEGPLPKLTSTFQKRMVRNDFRSSLFPTIIEKIDETDLIVMDTNIERLGVFEMSDGTYLTRSHELYQSGYLDSLEAKPRWIPTRDPEYLTLYKAAAERLVETLKGVGAFERFLVVDAPLAEFDSNGEVFDSYLGRPVEETRKHLRTLTQILSDMGLKVIELPSHLAVGDVNHQWGRSPLHYTQQANEWVADKFRIEVSNIAKGK